jgi:hypothetical protein
MLVLNFLPIVLLHALWQIESFFTLFYIWLLLEIETFTCSNLLLRVLHFLHIVLLRASWQLEI